VGRSTAVSTQNVPENRSSGTAARAVGAVAATTAVPELTVVIVTYNCAALARDCLASLATERARLALEVIVVDNASSDGTPDAVEAEFPWATVVRAGRNLGFAAANNVGLRQARGRHLLLLNPDTVVPSGALGRCLEELQRHPHVGMLGCRLVRRNGALDHACKRGFPTPTAALWYLLGFSRLWPRNPRLASYTAGHVASDAAAQVDAICGSFMLVRREAYEQVGALDEQYWMYSEDIDWCVRFHERGWRVLYWPGVTVLHVKGGCGGRRSLRCNYAFHRGMWLFYRKHYLGKYNPLVTAAVAAGIVLRLSLSVAWQAVGAFARLPGHRGDRDPAGAHLTR
jgi:GT2 family glycosyltransferase